MKSYPSITNIIRKGVPVFVFPKFDGSLVRAEWGKKKGFWKFGRKNGLLDDSNPLLARKVPYIFKEKYEEDISKILTDLRATKAILFGEFFGENSFAGSHEEEQHTIMLFDIALDNSGLLEPKEFLRLTKNIDCAQAINYGNFTDDLAEQVRNSSLPGMTFEGVIAKGSYVSPGLPLMFKVKSQAWLDRLKNKCGNNEALFRQLA